MGALANGHNGRLGGANQLGDLAVGQLGVELDQPRNRRRAVLALGKRGVARAFAFHLAFRGGVEHKLKLGLGITLAAGDFVSGKLLVGNRIKTLYANRHFTVGNAVDLQLVQVGKGCDLLEIQRCIVNQPHGGGFWHKWQGHGFAPINHSSSRAENSGARGAI